MMSPSLHEHVDDNRSLPNPNPDSSSHIITNSITNSVSLSSAGNGVFLRQKVMEDLSKFLRESSKTIDLIQSRLSSSQRLTEATENINVSHNGREECWNVLSSNSSGQHHGVNIHLLQSNPIQKETCNTTSIAADSTQFFQLEEETNRTFESNANTTPQAPKEADLKAFLEEIRKTYQSWLAKQKNLLPRKTVVPVDEVMLEIEREAQLPDEVSGKKVDASVQVALESSTKQNCVVFRRSRVKLNKEKTAAKENSQVVGNPNQESADGINIISEDGVTIVNNFVTPNKPDNKIESTMALTKWASKDSNSMRELRIQQYQRTVEVIASPDWLPEGWITELKTRGSGNSAGTKDKYYVEPITKRRFRSRKEVIDFLETGKSSRQRKRTQTSPMRRIFEAEAVVTPAKLPPKRAKSRENVTPRSMVHPSTGSCMSAPSGKLRNTNVPHRSGQPSEWLVYENLASLPFPMFEPFRYGEFNSKKSNSSQSSSMAQRPWFFTGPDTSWMPYMGKRGEKGRDYQNSYIAPSVFKHTPEPALKKTGRNRKSSKKIAK